MIAQLAPVTYVVIVPVDNSMLGCRATFMTAACYVQNKLKYTSL